MQQTETTVENHKQPKCRLVDSSLQNNSAPKAQGTLWKKGQKEWKSQRVRKFAVRLCFLVMSEATPVTTRQRDCLNTNELSEDSSDRHAKLLGKSP